MARFTSICVSFLLALVLAFPARAASSGIPAPVEAMHKADNECIDYGAKHMKEARVTARLGENETLYLLPCYSGAYNLVYRIYVYDSRHPGELASSLFAGYSDELGWYGKDYLINAHYDAETGTLTAFEKSRGLGDCGSAPKYRWAGHAWRLVEYRYWGQCDGSRMPEEWPVIYRFEGDGKQ